MKRFFRRAVPLAATVLLAAGCAGQAAKPQVKAMSGVPGQPSLPVADLGRAPVGYYRAATVSGDYAAYPALVQFIDRMVSRHGFSREYLNGLFSQAHRKQWTLDYMNRQAPTGKPSPGGWSRYRAKFVDETHIGKGAAFWSRYESALRQASERYGVPSEYIMAIMGVETLFGSNVGNHRVIDALTTLAFDYPRRAQYFTDELESFLVMVRTEGLDPSQPVGSFAGAMGLGQFMPASFLRWAVDFDGDGRRNLWEPVDAIGSVANYFAQHGWQRGEPVVTPAAAGDDRAEALEAGFDTHYSLFSLAQVGIRPVAACPADRDYHLLRLSAYGGNEYWLGHPNFYAITRYNNSTHYAMAVHQLAQAIKARHGGGLALR